MVNTGEKTWITEICPAVTDLTEIHNSLPHDPLPTATQLSLGYAFFDMVLPLLTDATNLNKIQMHRPMNTMSLHCFYVFVQIGIWSWQN